MRKNYVTRALEALYEFFVPTFGEPTTDLYTMGLERAAVFTIQDLHNVWDIDLSGVDFSTLSLPYPIVAIEYDFPVELLNVKAKSFVTWKNTPDPVEWKTIGAKRVALAFHSERLDTLVIVPFWYSELEGFWMLCPVSAHLTRESMNHVADWLGRREGREGMTPYVKGTIRDVHWLEEHGYTQHHMTRDVSDDIKVVLGLMALLTCSNVEIREEPAPKMLNKKRVKKGKLPLPMTRSIVLRHSAHAIKKAQAERTHASPRPHWRRGHRRTLSNDRHIWVRPCRVGPGDADLPAYEVL